GRGAPPRPRAHRAERLRRQRGRPQPLPLARLRRERGDDEQASLDDEHGRALGRRDVLVDPEDVARVVAALQRLQATVLLGAVGLADALLALVAEEIHVDARLVRLERGPEGTHPVPLALEPVGVLGAGADVVGEAGVAAVERRAVLADAADGAAHL